MFEKSPNKRQLEEIASSQGGPHLSIYLLVTDKLTQQISTRRELICNARRCLVANGMSLITADRFLSPLQDLSFDCRHFENAASVAMFLNQKALYSFVVAERLKDYLALADDFFIRPIIPSFQQRVQGYVLALDIDRVALYAVTENALLPIEVPEIHESSEPIASYMQFGDVRQGSASRTHQADSYPASRLWQDGEHENQPENVRERLQSISRSLLSRCTNTTLPLALACTDGYFKIFSEVNECCGLRKVHLPAVAVDHNLGDLHFQALRLINGEGYCTQREAVQRIRENLGSPLATAQISEIVGAAFAGKVDTLLFEETASVAGMYDCQLKRIDFQREHFSTNANSTHTDLIEASIKQTLKHKGNVFCVSSETMPTLSPMSALMRP